MRTFFVILAVFFLSAGLVLGKGSASENASTETLKQQLTPEEIREKITELRARIGNASTLSAQYKGAVQLAFDHLGRTQYGGWVLAKADPKLQFRLVEGRQGFLAAYSPDTNELLLTRELLDDLVASRTRDDARLAYFQLVGVLAHEIVHSIQFSNNLLDLSDNSFTEKIIIHRVMELNAMLAQTFVQYQMMLLPEFAPLLQQPGLRVDAKQALIGSLVRACIAQGQNQLQAETFARTKFVELFWTNASIDKIPVGKAMVPFHASMIKSWNDSYNMDAFRFFCTGDRADLFSQGHTGIVDLLESYVFLMGIALPPSFFQDMRATSFVMPFRERLMSFYDGRVSMVIDALENGYVAKSFDHDILRGVTIYLHDHKLREGIHQETYSESNIVRARYQISQGAMNGSYQEFDKDGNPLLELSVQGNIANGAGWFMVNGRQIPLNFVNGQVFP